MSASSFIHHSAFSSVCHSSLTNVYPSFEVDQDYCEFDCLIKCFYLLFDLAYTVLFPLLQHFEVPGSHTDIGFRLMNHESFQPDINTMQNISSIYFVLTFSSFINFLTMYLVSEKEKKIREGMLMMGLQPSAIW